MSTCELTCPSRGRPSPAPFGCAADTHAPPLRRLLHGYGASLGFFYRNLEAFGAVSASNGRRACEHANIVDLSSDGSCG